MACSHHGSANHDDDTHKEALVSELSWLPGLAEFLRQHEGAEAIRVDPKRRKIEIATLGVVDITVLEGSLKTTLLAIEDDLRAKGKIDGHIPASFTVTNIGGGVTELQKPSCYTAPTLWQWREVPWPESEQEAMAHGAWEWKYLAALAGTCGVTGLLGYFFHQFQWGPAWISGVLFIISIISGAWEPTLDVFKKVPKGIFDIHLLMLAVALGSCVIGAWQEGALLLFLFSSSEAMEHFAFYRTRRGIDALFKSAPKEAITLNEKGEQVRVAIDTVTTGMKIFIKPGDTVPVDALVLSGESASDESSLTGESVPVSKAKGDTVLSGTQNLWGVLETKALRPASESSLQKVIRLIRDAQHLKAKSQRFTDKFGSHYTIGILIATIVMFGVWWIGFGIAPFKNEVGAYSAFYRAMTLLVVASPCALVLSIPSAILASIAWGAQKGILFRGGAAIEELAQVDWVAMDKTGTLTTGELVVDRIESFPPGQEERLARLAFSLEHNANHPLARAIVRHGNRNGYEVFAVESFKSLTGLGVQGIVEGKLCVLGRRELLAEGPLRDWAETLPEPSPEYSEVWLVQDELIGRLLLKDQIRTESADALAELKSMGIHTVMLTGDRRSTAEAVGRELGIEQVRSGLKPEDKVDIIRKLTEQGHKVAMVGDGVNDAPSLAAAYVSVAMGARGSDAALEQSEVVLMNDRIDNFLNAYKLSQAATRVIRQNLAISLGTICIMVCSAMFGLVPLTLGVVAHEGSTAIVCLNSLRLLLFKTKSHGKKGSAKAR